MMKKGKEVLMTTEELRKEEALIQEALAKSPILVPQVDTLLGEEVLGFEGVYWYPIENDPTEAGVIKSGAGVSIPLTIHIPTGSNCSYRKVLKVINGEKRAVWEIHQKDLNGPSEYLGD